MKFRASSFRWGTRPHRVRRGASCARQAAGGRLQGIDDHLSLTLQPYDRFCVHHITHRHANRQFFIPASSRARVARSSLIFRPDSACEILKASCRSALLFQVFVRLLAAAGTLASVIQALITEEFTLFSFTCGLGTRRAGSNTAKGWWSSTNSCRRQRKGFLLLPSGEYPGRLPLAGLVSPCCHHRGLMAVIAPTPDLTHAISL